MRLLFFFLLIFSSQAFASKDTSHLDLLGEFSGRISHINEPAALLRIKVDFTNLKYLNTRDRVEFWDQTYPAQRCTSFVVGKSNDYLLLKVPNYEFCERFMFMALGTYLHFYSRDLVNNLKMGTEVMDILLKRRLALEGQVARETRQVDIHIEKVNAVNGRFEVLRQKLLAEWQKELSDLEEDKTVNLRNLENARAKLNEVDKKLEIYRIEDENLKVDRWALDPQLYIKK